MKIPQNTERNWWDKDAKNDHIKSAAAVSSTGTTDPFIKLPDLPSKDDVYNKIILDIGCGYGRTLIPLAKMGPKTAYGVDISRVMLGHCKTYARAQKVKLKLIYAALPKLPFKFKSIDLIFSSSVLLHLPKTDIPVLLEEIKRVLRSGGKAVFVSSFPNSLSINGASNWFPTIAKAKLLNKDIIPGMPKHYTYWELKRLLVNVGLKHKIDFAGYQLIPTSINRFPLPAKSVIEKFNHALEDKLKTKNWRIINFFLPRFFEVTLYS